MPLITETYYLSLTQDNRGILRLRCSQDDTLRTVNLKLYNNGSIFVIPSGVSASISGVKQNGAVFSKPCTISQNRENVVLQLSSDITNVDGIIVAEIVLNDGEGGRLGTSNFIIQVEKNPIRAGVVQDTETPIEYINDFIEKIQTLTARLNNLITPSGDPSLAEVVDARIGILDSTTYQTLGARLNAEFQRLSNALNGVTILESTGDTTDRTSEILSKLNAYGICKLGKGDFYVNGLVMPEGSQLIGSGKSTRIILPSSVTNGYVVKPRGYVVKPRSNCIIENVSFYGGFTGTYSELIASGSSAQRHCIILDRFDSISSENVILDNIFINNFVGSAIIQRYTVGCHCEDVIIDMCYAGIDISNASYDGQLVNVSMSNTRFGVVQNGSNFVFTNCVSKDSAYHIMSDQQNTGCTFSSCSFSESSLETTSKLASISNAREGITFDNCLFDSSLSMLLNACDGIVIKGTNFVGSDTFTITVSNGRNTLLLITDCIADVEPVVTNAGTAARITSCYLKDGTAWSISEADITVDDELSDESENPVQNKVINRAVSELKADLLDYESVPITGTDESSKTINSTANVVNATAGYHCVTYAISGGDRVRISGSASAHGYYYIFTDGSTTLKTSNVNNTSEVTSIVDVIDTAPDEASALIVSYHKSDKYENARAVKMTEIGLRGITELTNRVSTLEGLTDTTENITPVSQDAITIVDNYYTSSTNGHIESTLWRYAMYAIPSGTNGLQVTAKAGQNARLWILLNSTDGVLEVSSYSGAPVTLTETINLSDYPTASKVVVNDRKSNALAISTVVYSKSIDGHDVYVDGKALPSILNDHPDDKMYGKIICACGDSITYGADMDADGIVQTSNIDVYQSNGSGVFSKTTANFRKTWNYIIASRHNMTLYNAGVSGSTIQGISERGGFSISNGRYTKLPDNIDYLLIWFGWNDTAYGTLGTIEDSTNESYYGGYNVVLPYLIDKYPYAKIGLIVPFGTDKGHRNAIRQLGNKWGVAVWDNYQGGTPLYYGKENSVGVDANIVTENRAKYQALGAHPNFKGHTQLADMIEEWMKGI